MFNLTPAQTVLLAKLQMRGALYVKGAKVRVARSLEALGLATLTDNGSLDGHGNRDGERWYVEAKEAAP